MNINLAQAGDKEDNALRFVARHDFTGCEKLNTEGDGGFIPRVKPVKSTAALAAEDGFSSKLRESASFSAAGSVGPNEPEENPGFSPCGNRLLGYIPTKCRNKIDVHLPKRALQNPQHPQPHQPAGQYANRRDGHQRELVPDRLLAAHLQGV